MKKYWKEIALFIGGTAFGSAGFKLLGSDDAKSAYAHVTAAGLRVKECVMKTVGSVQESAGDILAKAQDINEARAAKAEAAAVADTAAEAEAEAEA